MREKTCFAVLPDVQLGRELFAINFYDPWWLSLCGIPQKEAVVGEKIAERLKKAVEWINNQNVEFVTTVGDLTDSATPEQFKLVGEILKGLKKPFVPLMGNHDVWPYRREKGRKAVIWNAERPLTVSEFEAYFKEWRCSPRFEGIKGQKRGLQNFAFTIKGIRFVMIDNNNRRKSPFGLPGAAGWSRLYLESREWLKEQISSSKEENIIVLSHAALSPRLLKRSWGEIINIAGHTHKRTEHRWQNITILTTNALYHEPLVLLVEAEGGIKTEYHRI